MDSYNRGHDLAEQFNLWLKPSTVLYNKHIHSSIPSDDHLNSWVKKELASKPISMNVVFTTGNYFDSRKVTLHRGISFQEAMNQVTKIFGSEFSSCRFHFIKKIGNEFTLYLTLSL